MPKMTRSKRAPRGPLRMAAAMLLSAALTIAPAVQALAQEPFCRTLASIMDDTPNKYLTFKAGKFDEDLQQWEASIHLPGFEDCAVDIELDNYVCVSDELPRPQADAREKQLVDMIGACLPDAELSTDVDEEDDYIRTVTTWQTRDGVQVEIGKMTEKDGEGRSVIFVYVEAMQ